MPCTRNIFPVGSSPDRASRRKAKPSRTRGPRLWPRRKDEYQCSRAKNPTAEPKQRQTQSSNPRTRTQHGYPSALLRAPSSPARSPRTATYAAFSTTLMQNTRAHLTISAFAPVTGGRTAHRTLRLHCWRPHRVPHVMALSHYAIPTTPMERWISVFVRRVMYKCWGSPPGYLVPHCKLARRRSEFVNDHRGWFPA